MNIRISNLGYNITGESIRAVFATYGEVSSWSVFMDEFSGHSIGTVFVEMPDHNEAMAAISKINGSVIDGCVVTVIETRTMTKK